MKITLENFNEHNRTKIIGNSLYRICRNDKKRWYIHETYNDGKTFSLHNDFFSNNIGFVIDNFNKISKERELVATQFG